MFVSNRNVDCLSEEPMNMHWKRSCMDTGAQTRFICLQLESPYFKYLGIKFNLLNL